MGGLLLFLLLLSAASITGLGMLGLMEKLPPNRVAGIRTAYAMASPENWYRVHRAAAPLLIWGGVAATMASLAFLPFAIAGKLADGLVIGLVAVIAAVILLSVLMGSFYGLRAARRAPP